MEEWETATDGLAVMTPLAHDECIDYDEFIPTIAALIDDSTLPEDEMDEDDLEDTISVLRAFMDHFRKTGLIEVQATDSDQNDIRGLHYTDSANQFLYQNSLFDIAKEFYGRTSCFELMMEAAQEDKVRGCFAYGDILISFGNPVLNAGPSADPNFTVRFDTCQPHSYYYGLVVHEAGHALGILHPPLYKLEIDTVMNYVFINGVVGSCSPSFLDVMAVYAMYQVE